jgi:hypothetical protein
MRARTGPGAVTFRRRWMALGRILRELLARVATPLLARLYPLSTRAVQRLHPELHPRVWSNHELRRWAPFFAGEIVNVSGWKDEDKQGGHYRDYFPRATRYAISNLGAGQKGSSGWPDEIVLDLSEPADDDLRGRFDVVFNHSTLEHIYDVHTAMANLCHLTRDALIVVVPFSQFVHWREGSFSDYWRFTPFAMFELMKESGVTPLYWAANETRAFPTNLLVIGSKSPERWRETFPELPPMTRPTAPGHSWGGYPADPDDLD